MESNSNSEDSMEVELEELRKVALKINPVELDESQLSELFLEIYLHLYRVEESETRLRSLQSDTSFKDGNQPTSESSLDRP